MRTERQGLKAGSYVGGLLHLFDWNAKSQKKFTSKAELPKKLKQKKRFDGNLPTTLLQMQDEDEFAAGGSSLKGSNDYSCASSLTENDFYTSKAPNVVARLMGLDSLPISNFLDPNFTPLPICQSSTSTHYKSKSLDFSEDFEFKCGNFAKRQIDDFRSEMSQPISVKPVSITYHKLLSPAKNSSFVPPKDATHIIEAAAGTINPGPKASEKTNMALRVRESKEKVQAVKKTLKSDSRHSSTRSWDGSVDYSRMVDVKDKGKSVSLASQAKANVRKRALVSHKETSESSTNRVLASQSQAQRCALKKPSAQKGMNVLRPPNQKKNCPANRKKAPPLKSGSQGGKKAPISDFTSSRQRNLGSLAGPTRVSSSKLASEVRDDKRRVMSHSSAGVSHDKRSFDGNSRSEKKRPKGKNGNLVDSGGATDIVSLTLSAPVAGQGAGSVRSSISPSKRILLDPVGMGGPRFLSLGQSVNDILRNTFLEGKPKELSQKEFSQQKTKHGVSADNLEGQPGSSYMQDGHSCSIITVQKCQVKYVDIFAERPSLDNWFPSPVSVFDCISITESSNSSETEDSNSSRGGNHYSSIHFQEADLSDSASSTSKAAAKTGSTTLNSPYHNKPRNVELIYIKKLLSNIEPMFKDYALGKTSEIIKPRIFRQLEIQEKGHLNGVESISRLDRRLIFDCVKECLDLRCRHFAKGGYELWAKGVFVVKRTDLLAENVYKDISCWGSMGHCMVDEIVGRDMSSKNGTWLDYDVDVFELGMKIESRLLSNLIDEVVDDILVL